MIAHGLIIGAGIAKANIEQLKMSGVGAGAKSDADEAGHPRTGRPR